MLLFTVRVLPDTTLRPVTVAALPVVFWFRVGNVQFVKVPEAGVPNAGVTSVNDVQVPVGV